MKCQQTAFFLVKELRKRVKQYYRFIARNIVMLIHGDFRIIVDKERKLGDFGRKSISYRTDLCKEEVSRLHVLGRNGCEMTFLDVGGRDGLLTYLLGIKSNLDFDQGFYEENLKIFNSKYRYFGMDLKPEGGENVLTGDACSEKYLDNNEQFFEFFDVIYSNNVFEHFQKPWVAAKNITKLLKPNGIVVTVVPFSQRYHESPGDFYRYTHKGVEALFQAFGNYDVLEAGYDINGRRINWQGDGEHSDIVPVDSFGAWRETWFTVNVMRKLSNIN